MIERATVNPPIPESNTPIGRESGKAHHHSVSSTSFSASSRSGDQAWVDRYFHPPSASRHTISPVSSREATRRATCTTAPDEDSLPLGELPGRAEGVGGRDQDLCVEDPLVEDRGNEAVLERAQAVDQ